MFCMAAFFSSSSSNPHTAAKSLAAAAAEREAHCYTFTTDDEEAIPPAPITPLPPRKRKMSQFFDETTAPTEIPSVSTALTLHFAAPPSFEEPKNAVGPTPSPNIARSSYVFTPEGKPADEMVPTEAGVSTHLSLHLAGPPDSKNAIGPSPNMARSSFPSSTPSEVNPADERAPTRSTGVSTHLSLRLAGPPTFKKTKNATGPNRGPNMVRSSFPSSSTLSEAQFDEGKGKIPRFFDFFASEAKLDVDTTTLPAAETGVSTHLSLPHFAGPAKKTAVVIRPRYSPPAPIGVVVPALTDRWDIKKVLKKSDVDDSSRLLLSKVVVHEHILPHVIGNGPGLDEGQGVEVAVWDMDTGSEHVLVLKKWKTGSFVLIKKWMSDFVRRRGLEKNDEIGLRWDDGNSRLDFTVLKKNLY